MRNPERRDSLIALLLIALVVIVTLLITKAQERFSLRELAEGAALTMVALSVIVGLGIAFSRNRYESQLNSIVNQLRAVVSLIHYPWLLSDEELAKAESEVKGDSIWIVSPDLVNVTEKPEIKEAVKRNISRGITYTYIVPDSYRVKMALPHLKQLDKSRRRLNIIELSQEEFRLLAVTHIAVFNAGPSSDVASLEVFIELPIQEAEGQKLRGFWIRVETQAAKDLAGRFTDIVQKYYPTASAKR